MVNQNIIYQYFSKCLWWHPVCLFFCVFIYEGPSIFWKMQFKGLKCLWGLKKSIVWWFGSFSNLSFVELCLHDNCLECSVVLCKIPCFYDSHSSLVIHYIMCPGGMLATIFMLSRNPWIKYIAFAFPFSIFLAHSFHNHVRVSDNYHYKPKIVYLPSYILIFCQFQLKQK